MAFNPTLHSLTGKAMGFSQATPTDARSYFFDATNFVYRPYQDVAEVLSYLNLSKYRFGNFSIYVNVGGTLNGDGTFTGGTISEYSFKDGTADLDLVLSSSGGGGGAADFTDLGDAATADLPSINTPLGDALDLKAPIASPTFTGTVAGITKTMVGLPNVDNTADTAKPVSTAQAAADTAVQAFSIQRANHTGTQAATTIVEDSTHRFVTDAEKTTWNAGGGVSDFGDLADATTVDLTTVNTPLAERLSGLPNHFNVLDYGALGNGVNDAPTRAANTAAILAAVADCKLVGSGVIYFPFTGGGHYFVDPIVIPGELFSNAAGWTSLEFMGETMPQKIFGTIGTMAPDGFPDNRHVVIECPSTTPGGFVIKAAPASGGFENLSAIHLILTRLEIRTYDNPFIGGIDALKAQQFTIRDCAVTTGVYSVDAAYPSNITGGIITPQNGNAALTEISNTMISGYYTALVAYEHLNGDGVIIAAAVNGVYIPYAGHAVYFKHLDMMNCQNFINIDGLAVLHVEHLNMEFVEGSVWQDRVATIYEPKNIATGHINWANTKAGTGRDDTIVVVGGRGITITPLHIVAADREVIGDITTSDPVLLQLIQRLTEKGIILNETSLGVTRLPDGSGGYTKAYIPNGPSTAGWVNTDREWTNATNPAYAQVAPPGLTFGSTNGWVAVQYKSTAADGGWIQANGNDMGFGFSSTGEVVWLNATTETGTGTMATLGYWYRLRYNTGTWTIEESPDDGATWPTVVYTFLGTPPSVGNIYWLSGYGSGGTATIYYPQGTW